MLVNVLRSDKRKLWCGAALLLMTGMTTGCSSQMTRLNSVDDIFTGSTSNQREVMNRENQGYPANTAATPIDGVTTASVSRSELSPVSSTTPINTAPVASSQPKQEARFETASVEPFGKADTETTVKSAQPSIKASEPAGWSRSGGAKVTVKEGDTVSSLSRRFGVPANVIAQVNGLPKGGALQAGQQVIIPTYSQSKEGSKEAKSTIAATGDVPFEKASSKGETVAALPEKPKAAAVEAEATANTTKLAKSGGYTVESGDTLSKIARKTGVSVSSLKAANGLDEGVLKIGQTLKVPSGETVAKISPSIDKVSTNSIEPAAKKATEAGAVVAETVVKKVDSKVIEQAEASTEKAPNSTGIDRMRWPVRGKVISSYGKGAGKSGIDIAVPEGTPVKAAENGVVIYAGDGLKDFGNTVLVRHDNGLVTVYGHASQLKVQRGQKVKRGDEIAVSGMSGSADAPKLHFEVRKNSAPVDPSGYLE